MNAPVLERARALATSLAQDAAARDRDGAGAEPEIAKLKASGLLGATAPAAWGGEQLPFATALQALRLVAAQDNACAMLLGYHWVVLRTAEVQGGFTAALARCVAQEGYLAGVTNARDADLQLSRDGSGFVLSGRRTFCTGARVADLLFVAAALEGRPANLVIDADRAGIEPAQDWDAFGERGSESGSVTFSEVAVAEDELLVSGAAPSPSQSLSAPLIQLLFVNLYLGAAQGALQDAVRYVRAAARPWPGSGVERAPQDPYIAAAVGSMHADLLGALALADAAAREMDEALAEGPQLSSDRRGEVAVSVYAAKLLANRVGLEVTSRVFEVMGARATGRRDGYDRRWRDLRVHTLHDPIAYKAREVGAYVLEGTVPVPSNYS